MDYEQLGRDVLRALRGRRSQAQLSRQLGYRSNAVFDWETGRRSLAFDLFGVSTEDLERPKNLQRAYFRELRAIVAQSEPVEHVVLANVQLVPLSASAKAAPANKTPRRSP